MALDWYARDGPDDVTEGEKLRAYQLVESIAHLHGTVSLGSARFLDSGYFDQYARGTSSEQSSPVALFENF